MNYKNKNTKNIMPLFELSPLNGLPLFTTVGKTGYATIRRKPNHKKLTQILTDKPGCLHRERADILSALWAAGILPASHEMQKLHYGSAATGRKGEYGVPSGRLKLSR